MGSTKTTHFLILCTFLVSISFQQANAIRALGMEKWLREEISLFASLPRGPVPPSGGSPCTYIPGHPGSSTGSCPLNEKHFAGSGAAHSPPASPRSVINFGSTSSTTTNHETGKNDSTSWDYLSILIFPFFYSFLLGQQPLHIRNSCNIEFQYKILH